MREVNNNPQATPLPPPGCRPGTACHHRVLGCVQEMKVGWELPWPGSSTSSRVSGTVGPSPLLILACFQGGALTLKSKSCGLQDFAQTPSQASLCPGLQVRSNQPPWLCSLWGLLKKEGQAFLTFQVSWNTGTWHPFLSAFPTLTGGRSQGW